MAVNLYLFWIAHVTNFYNIMQSYNLKLCILCPSPEECMYVCMFVIIIIC